jgi:N-acetyl-anhydromuramyl-L-alanine amidase AmpD
MRIDDMGWLFGEAGDPVIKQYPTVRTYVLSVPVPLGIVWHWTAGRGGPGFAESLARRAQSYRKGVDRPASWHVLISKDGTIYQSAPFTVGTWHVGRPGLITGRRFENVNRATIGCELENAGRLRMIDGRCYCWPYWLNPGAPRNELRADPKCLLDSSRAVIASGDGLFDEYTPEQEASALRMLVALAATYSWARAACGHGHVDFDWPRKEDPGPLWKQVHLKRVLEAIFDGGLVASASPAPSRAQGA